MPIKPTLTFLSIKTSKLSRKNRKLRATMSYSFPFHRLIGKIFTYNENVFVATKKLS